MESHSEALPQIQQENGWNNKGSGSISGKVNRANQSRASKATASRIATIQSAAAGSGKPHVNHTVTEGGFVPYLPQDDAVVAGLGEEEGGVDASETQEVIDLLNEQLGALLRLPPRQFWKRVVTDESLNAFLDSYLQFRRRWFDNPPEGVGVSKVSVVAGDGDLSRRVFMVLLRMSSNQDPGTSSTESLSAKEHAAILQERKLLDIPKLMDLSAIYCHDNQDLTRRLVSNVFKAQPKYSGELAAYVLPLLERIMTMHQRCVASIEAIQHPRDSGTIGIEGAHAAQKLLEVVDFLNDVVITLKAFVKSYPPAANILVSSGNPLSGQGLLLPALATVHDTLLPILREGFKVLGGSAGGQKEVVVAAEDHLRKLSNRLVDLSWLLIQFRYLEDQTGDDWMKAAAALNEPVEDGVWKGDSLMQTIIALAMGPCDNNDINGELDSSVSRLICTGALLQSMQRRHGLLYHISQACGRGVVTLDEAQQDNLSTLMADNKVPSGEQDGALIMSSENFPQLLLLENDVVDETAIQQSKISQIKDLFPEYGDGFIAACLEAYDSDPEKVIQRILEGTLHSDLASLEISLTDKPNKPVEYVKDKGKGKVNEQPLSTKGKTIWEEQNSSGKGSGSSSSVAGGSISSSEGTLPGMGAKIGRYVRHRKEDGNLSALLDSRNDDKELSAAIKAAAAKIEYEDEYDDSFDELGAYVADTGGNEETEILADQVGYRGRAQGENTVLRNSGRPSALTPWGETYVKGKPPSVGASKANVSSGFDFQAHDTPSRSSTHGGGHLAGGPRARAEQQRWSPVVPEIEGQTHETSRGVSIPKGRGSLLGAPRSSFQAQRLSTVVPEVEGQPPAALTAGEGTGGRGRKKRKDQGPKPQFYLKEGKLYSYKVAGAVGVSSIEEAEAIKQEEVGQLYGLGAGGNVPIQQLDAGARDGKVDGNEDNSKFRRDDGSGEGGRGRGGSSRGRGGPGRGYARKDNDNHNRKDRATKKHFGSLGGL